MHLFIYTTTSNYSNQLHIIKRKLYFFHSKLYFMLHFAP